MLHDFTIMFDANSEPRRESVANIEPFASNNSDVRNLIIPCMKAVLVESA